MQGLIFFFASLYIFQYNEITDPNLNFKKSKKMTMICHEYQNNELEKKSLIHGYIWAFFMEMESLLTKFRKLSLFKALPAI